MLLIEKLPKKVGLVQVRRALAERLGLAFEDVYLTQYKDGIGVRLSKSVDHLIEEVTVNGKILGIKSVDEKDFKRRQLFNQVTPLWSLSYEEQLAFKQDSLQKLVNLPLDPVRAAPQPTGYRNKCEFTVGRNSEGVPTVGFLLGGFKDGLFEVADASECLHVHPQAKRIVSLFENYIRGESKLLPFDRKMRTGHWRLLLVRIHGDKSLVVVQTSKDNAEREQVKQVLSDVDSLYWQECDALHHGLGNDFELLHGTPWIEEKLKELTFRISPASFFQVNTPGAVLLYDTIAELAQSQSSSALLDLCCGTGTIGLSLSKHFEQVIGIECVKEAVEDARLNASLNNITNATFHAGRLEDKLHEVISCIPSDKEIVVVLDPPRAGAHKSVIQTILKHDRIKTLVYVSCSPEQASHNWKALELEFALKRAIPVDMFPQTEHCELVLLFERKGK